MQLLEMIWRFMSAFLIAFFSINTALADVNCSSANLVAPEMISCSQASFVKIDKVLNEQYKVLSTELDQITKSELLSTQKKWIKFKEEYCRGEIGEGEGASIEMLSCKKQLASFRVSELIYLRTGVIGDGFYKAVSLVNEKATSMNYPKAIEFVSGLDDFGSNWKEYASGNCAISSKLFGEVIERCVARMRFQIPIY